MCFFYSQLRPDDPRLNVKGRTVYKQHNVPRPRLYSDADIEYVKKYWKINPPPKPPGKAPLWASMYSPTDLTQISFSDIFNLHVYEDENAEILLSDSLPDPVTFLIYLLIYNREEKFLYFFPYLISADLATSPLELVITNPNHFSFSFFAAPPILSFKESLDSSSPSFVFTPSDPDGILPIISEERVMIDLSNISDDSIAFTLPY